MTNIRIFSYNILSPTCATPEYFENVDDALLDINFREKILKEILLRAIEQNSIICLQEVSNTWHKRLFPFFAKHNYIMKTAFYGSEKHDFMGVAIAYPHLIYKLLGYAHERLGNFINVNNSSSGYATEIMIVPPPMTQKHNWWCQLNKAKQKHNVILLFKFVFVDKAVDVPLQFVVANYHMPCEYKNFLIMQLHVHALKHIIFQALINNDLCFLACDMNSIMDSHVYRYLTMTKNKMNDSNESSCHLVPSCKDSTHHFEGIIDYIFYEPAANHKFRVTSVQSFFDDIFPDETKRTELLESADYITSINPSDHIPLCFKYEIEPSPNE